MNAFASIKSPARVARRLVKKAAKKGIPLRTYLKKVDSISDVPEVIWAEVDKEIASELLENGNRLGFVNRKKKSRSVKEYRNAINEHIDSPTGTAFRSECGETISLAVDVESGLVFPVNGQHRLQALVESDQPTHTFFVALFVNPGLFGHFDGGAARELKDYLYIFNHRDSGWDYDPVALSSFGHYLYKESFSGDAAIRPDDEDVMGKSQMFEWMRHEKSETIIGVCDLYMDKAMAIQRAKGGAAGLWLYIFHCLHRIGEDELASKVADYVIYDGALDFAMRQANNDGVKLETRKKHRAAVMEMQLNPVQAPFGMCETAIEMVRVARGTEELQKEKGGIGKAGNQFIANYTPRVWLSALDLYLNKEVGPKARGGTYSKKGGWTGKLPAEVAARGAKIGGIS